MKLHEKSSNAAAWKTLLVVINDPFVQTQPALAKAAAIARRSRGQVRLFNTFLIPEPVNDHVECDVMVIKPKGFKTPVRVLRRTPAARVRRSVPS